VIAVVGAERIDPRSLAGVISTADAMRASVVLVAGERTGWRDAAALQGIAAVVGIGTAQPARHPAGRAENALEVAVDEMNVVFVASPAGLRERVMADFDARREQGERAVVVVADRRLAEDLSADLSARRGATAATNAAATTAATTVAVAVATVTAVAVSPSRANDLVRAGAVDRLLMLGDASALSRAARRSTEGRRDHYVVDRFASYGLPSETRTGLALEIALPARIERQLGPRLDDPEARSAWRTAAAAHEGRGLLAEVKLREALRELAHCRGSELTPDALSPHVRAREGRSLPPR
jgi:hypothetical protein